ncbi:hypothetical protein [Saccharopolyspora spinosa]|uniref:Uncharacterized protein n=2 Tax=Saccharopolyspora spinosa TaxID=60894 RepID=A0A2N3Y1R1_SACSN|nr:hypothetical protein A8926_4749 [Saccharopolyspora spinosa]
MVQVARRLPRLNRPARSSACTAVLLRTDRTEPDHSSLELDTNTVRDIIDNQGDLHVNPSAHIALLAIRAAFPDIRIVLNLHVGTAHFSPFSPDQRAHEAQQLGAIVPSASQWMIVGAHHKWPLGSRPLCPLPQPITDPEQTNRLDIRRHEHLGGILHEYRHVA